MEDSNTVTEQDLTENESLGLDLGLTADQIRFEFGEDGVLELIEKMRFENNFDASFCF